MHASNDWDATTGAGWETGGGRGGGSGSGVLFASPQVALSSAAGGSCGVPGRPDIGGAGSCFVSLCTSWSALQFRSLGLGVPGTGKWPFCPWGAVGVVMYCHVYFRCLSPERPPVAEVI